MEENEEQKEKILRNETINKNVSERKPYVLAAACDQHLRGRGRRLLQT